MDRRTERKWDLAAKRLDSVCVGGPEKRWKPVKEKLFAHMGSGRILFVAVGTGLDIPLFPPGRRIVGLDISSQMLRKAGARVEAYDGTIELRHADIHQFAEPDRSFDQVFTSCTFCSVPSPVQGLRQVLRLLKPSGELYMFEHTGSRYVPFSLMLDLMTLISRRFGPDLNRPTLGNVRRAGFEVVDVENHFLDVVKTIHAVRPK